MVSKQTYGDQRGNDRGRDKSEAWDEHIHTTIYKTENQQRPPVEHRKPLLNIVRQPI